MPVGPVWRYEPVSDLNAPLSERLQRFPREPDLTVYLLRSLAGLFIHAWLRGYHRLEVVGRENLPGDGSFVMVANHASHLDALCLAHALPWRKLHRAFPAAAQDYFFVSFPRMALATIVVNALPFGRQAHIRESLKHCQALLGNPGNILILFPEGTRSSNGQMQPFKPGIGLLVAGTEIPVVPCYLEGAHRAWPKGRWLPRPAKLRLRIGPPRRYADQGANREAAGRVAADLEAAVRELAPATIPDTDL